MNIFQSQVLRSIHQTEEEAEEEALDQAIDTDQDLLMPNRDQIMVMVNIQLAMLLMEEENSLTLIRVLANGGLSTLQEVNTISLMLELETEEIAVDKDWQTSKLWSTTNNVVHFHQKLEMEDGTMSNALNQLEVDLLN